MKMVLNIIDCFSLQIKNSRHFLLCIYLSIFYRNIGHVLKHYLLLVSVFNMMTIRIKFGKSMTYKNNMCDIEFIIRYFPYF